MFMDRRAFIQVGAGAGLGLASSFSCQRNKVSYQQGNSPWPLCLNTSTIRPVSLTEYIRIAAATGYDGIELWVNDLEKYEAKGGDLKELGSKIKEQGLLVPNVIGLWDCMPMDEEQWKNSLNDTRNRMRMSSAVGAKHVAAIPAPDRADFDLKIGAERYRELIKIGREEYGIRFSLQ